MRRVATERRLDCRWPRTSPAGLILLARSGSTGWSLPESDHVSSRIADLSDLRCPRSEPQPWAERRARVRGKTPPTCLPGLSRAGPFCIVFVRRSRVSSAKCRQLGSTMEIRKQSKRPEQGFSWRRRPESNRRLRFCRRDSALPRDSQLDAIVLDYPGFRRASVLRRVRLYLAVNVRLVGIASATEIAEGPTRPTGVGHVLWRLLLLQSVGLCRAKLL
jgi:hypothetical protein